MEIKDDTEALSAAILALALAITAPTKEKTDAILDKATEIAARLPEKEVTRAKEMALEAIRLGFPKGGNDANL